ncbi:MAG: FAD-dependent oxidoreductase, partial [Pseudomonadota bacterium]|nr:FAD-dependent oxidoreductase [Pseudomonadota bacterium]
MKNIVIIGAGHGAGQLVMSLRQKKFRGHITLVGEEDWHPDQRPPLSKKFLSGELSAERLFLKPPAFYDDPSLSLVLNSRAMVIDRDARQIATNDGKAYDYDALVIATGSRPR